MAKKLTNGNVEDTSLWKGRKEGRLLKFVDFNSLLALRIRRLDELVHRDHKDAGTRISI